MGTETTVEFGVNLSCQKCVDAQKGILSGAPGISDFKVDLEKQSVVVTSTRPTSEIQALIESRGKRAVVLGTGSKDKAASRPLPAAVAMLGGVVGSGKVEGVVRFVQVDGDSCVIDGTVDGLSPGEHGLAIHECGDISSGCASIGDHYDPMKSGRHGSPADDLCNRHVGDLGNIVAGPDGRAQFKFSDRLVKVDDIIGRSLAVTVGRDDLGSTDHPLSKVNGNCGRLLTCGIIARSSGLFQNSKRICACDGITLWDERDKPLAGTGRSNN